MRKSKQLISRKVLQTELSVAKTLIEEMNLGYAKELIQQVLNRVKEYDLK